MPLHEMSVPRVRGFFPSPVARRPSPAAPQNSSHRLQHIREQIVLHLELEREVRELRKTNEILKLASAYFAQAEFDRQLKK